MDHEDIINVAIRHIPEGLREDARQAGYIGLLNGLKNKRTVRSNLRGYLYRCVTNEMIRELAKLHKPFALNSQVFNLLLKYKKLKRFGKEKLLGCNKMTIEELEELLRIRQWSYDAHDESH